MRILAEVSSNMALVFSLRILSVGRGKCRPTRALIIRTLNRRNFKGLNRKSSQPDSWMNPIREPNEDRCFPSQPCCRMIYLGYFPLGSKRSSFFFAVSIRIVFSSLLRIRFENIVTTINPKMATAAKGLLASNNNGIKAQIQIPASV